MNVPRTQSSPTRARGRVALAGTAALISASIAGAAGAAGAPLVLSARAVAHVGVILQSTRTVYTLTPSHVACTATCLHYWPEVLLPRGTTKAVAAKGVDARRLGTIKRAGGRLQVTYNGKPLYWFAFDTAPGQVHGNVTDAWGKWSDVVLARVAPNPRPTTTTTSGGGYSY